MKENNELGPDCVPNSGDEPDVTDEPGEQGECPETYVWDSEICGCVTREHPDCDPTIDPDNYLCVWDFTTTSPPECDCVN